MSFIFHAGPPAYPSEALNALRAKRRAETAEPQEVAA